uniref:NADH-ubiquinone oxidoreductase chain 5 n=1 Tax=Paratapes undulatus TaxID=2602928 RepID=H6BHV4_9BIVA|nr:NADH dehydrogenase subunit 5 [Paratapes undulatus]AEH99645.1 NADH dehydrogenase subunit 5 [Paratapes undulatus]
MYLCVWNAAGVYFFSCLVLVVFMMKVGLGEGLRLVIEWESSESFLSEVGFSMMMDWVSCLFVVSVLFISGCVNLFSGFYMSHETFLKRFSHILHAFVLSMVILILFPGYLGLMVGWDGLGVVSFLLVVYYMNSGSLSAGMITAISNRIGDVCFILAIGLFSSFLSYSLSGGDVFELMILGVLIMLGSMTKSAQVPFSAWLPEAMAAPTPVSTLVHSSTLVTAGVYVLIRFSDYLGEAEKSILMILSMMTILLAGSSGVFEVDMKKVVALSTLSQVGMMMFTISMGANVVAFFHLLVHAFFKAGMFMCVGGVIFYSGYQDARFLGGVWFKLPMTGCLLMFSNLSLMGFPFLSGFYSKELIVGSYLVGHCSLVSFLLLFLSLAFTVFYAFRLMMLTVRDGGLSGETHYKMESGFYMLSLIFMANGSISMAVVMQSYFTFVISSNIGSSFLRGDIFYLALGMVILTSFNIFLFMLLGSGAVFNNMMKSFLSKMWFLSPLSGGVISSSFLAAVSRFVSFVEMGCVRGYIWQNGLKGAVFSVSEKSRKVNFSMLGMVLFYCFCFVAMVFL